MSEYTRPAGKTTIAPDVLLTIARLTALSIPGVNHLSNIPGGVNRLFARGVGEGVRIVVGEARFAAAVVPSGATADPALIAPAGLGTLAVDRALDARPGILIRTARTRVRITRAGVIGLEASVFGLARVGGRSACVGLCCRIRAVFDGLGAGGEG